MELVVERSVRKSWDVVYIRVRRSVIKVLVENAKLSGSRSAFAVEKRRRRYVIELDLEKRVLNAVSLVLRRITSGLESGAVKLSATLHTTA